MNRPHFRRHPRIAPDPARGKRPDRADGLLGYVSGSVLATGGTVPLDAGERLYPVDPEPNRYDGQWPDVLAAETLVDLPADQSGFTAPADWPVWDYGEGYEIEPEERASSEPVTVHIDTDVSRFHEAMAQVQAATAAVKPRGRHRQIGRGRHRQTGPLDLLLADLRDIEDRLS